MPLPPLPFKLTEEQQALVHTRLERGESLKVNAFAGTGKTTSLAAYAMAWPRKRFLYLAFNRSVAMEAREKFPHNVDCLTCHSLAFRLVGTYFRHANCLNTGALRIHAVMEALKLNRQNYVLGKVLVDTFNTFLASSLQRPALEHIPHEAGHLLPNVQPSSLLNLAEKYWQRMTDIQDREVPITHDGYLKLYQLRRPQLDYDCILLDEAQDITPCITDIVMQQTHASKILVGDPHQAIYSWRGAVNTLAEYQAQREQYLTHSFRFGPEIAKVANIVLRTLKHEPRFIQSRCPENREQTIKHQAQLARTNGELFKLAVEFMAKNRSFGFVGGVQSYRFHHLKDTWHLHQKRPNQVTDPFIRAFQDYAQMKEFALAVDDYEIMNRCNVVEQYLERTPKLVDDLMQKANDNLAQVENLMSTVHKAKGLEFDSVNLLDDYADFVEENELGEYHYEEANILYVAVTRARHELIANESLLRLIEFYHDHLNKYDPQAPSKDRKVLLSLRISEPQLEKLKSLAKDNQVSLDVMVERLIQAKEQSH